MDAVTISVIGIVAFVILMALGMPIAFCFILVGVLGLILLRGMFAGLSMLESAPFTWGSAVSLLPLPLFILMGQFAIHSGISQDLFDSAHKWIGRFRGGLALATTAAATGFAACSGSSVASAATMASVAYPEMHTRNYSDRLAAGSIAAGGTLAILIPPSSTFIIYGFLTNTSISKLFMAGIIPGLVLSALFMILIYIWCRINPSLGPAGPKYPWKEMIKSLKGIWGMAVLFVLVMGGIWLGIFTADEAGAIGAFGAIILFLIRRGFRSPNFIKATNEALRISCFSMLITVGGVIFGAFLTASGLTTVISQFILSLPVSRYLDLGIIILLCIVLGLFTPSLIVILLTVPFSFPIITGLGFDPVWFGILITILCEMGQITPPFAICIFIVQGVTKVPMFEIVRGVVPFIGMICVCIILMIIFPNIVLFLPSVMK
jgi:C4-dicarboxylate transporter, DctM subunit